MSSEADDLLDFVLLVSMMREAQRVFFAARKPNALNTAMRHEKLVDDALARIKLAERSTA